MIVYKTESIFTALRAVYSVDTKPKAGSSHYCKKYAAFAMKMAQNRIFLYKRHYIVITARLNSLLF